MKIHGSMDMAEGSSVKNFKLGKGNTYPGDAEEGELFYHATVGLSIYEAGGWTAVRTQTFEEIVACLGFTPANAASSVRSMSGRVGEVTIDKDDVGLGNVDNTADIAKPVSTAQGSHCAVVGQAAAEDATAKANAAQAASAPSSHVGSGGTSHATAVAGGASGFLTGADKTKLDVTSGTNTGDETTATIRSKLGITTLSGSNTGDQTLSSLGLANVDNTADMDKPVSTAQSAADAVVLGAASTDATAKANAAQAASSPLSHTHNQAQSHVGVDTDNAPTSIHHSLGLGANQAAAGNHTHSGVYIPVGGSVPWSNVSDVPTVVGILHTEYVQVGATTGTSLIPYDASLPLATEGTAILSVVKTALDASSKLSLSGALQIDCSNSTRTFILVGFRDSLCIGAIALNFITLAKPQILNFTFVDTLFGTTIGGSATYSLRVGVSSSATWYVNRTATSALGGAMSKNTVLVQEFV